MKTKTAARSRRELQTRMEAARQELSVLRSALTEAYRVFNRTADPALLEASILEISALQVRCDRLLHSIKEMNGESEHDTRTHRTSGHRSGTDFPAAQAAEKADKMGV